MADLFNMKINLYDTCFCVEDIIESLKSLYKQNTFLWKTYENGPTFNT